MDGGGVVRYLSVCVARLNEMHKSEDHNQHAAPRLDDCDGVAIDTPPCAATALSIHHICIDERQWLRLRRP